MKHSKKEQSLIKKDEELIKLLLQNLYQRKGSGMSGGSFSDFMNSFVQGFTMPFKDPVFSTIMDVVLPGSGTISNLAANAISDATPGKKYNSFGELYGGSKRRPGRPRTKPIVPQELKRKPGRPSKQH